MWTPLAFWHLLSADCAKLMATSWKCHPVPPASEHRWRKIVSKPSKPSKPKTQQMCVDDSWSAFVQLRCDLQTSRKKGYAMSLSLTCVIIHMSSNHVEVQQKKLKKLLHNLLVHQQLWLWLIVESSSSGSNLYLRLWYPICWLKQIKKNQRVGSQSIWMKLIVDHGNYWLLKASRPAFTKVQIYRTPSSRNVVALGECSAGATKARPTATCNWKGYLYPKDPSVYLYVLFLFFFLSLSLSVCIHMHILTDTLDWIGHNWIRSYIDSIIYRLDSIRFDSIRLD